MSTGPDRPCVADQLIVLAFDDSRTGEALRAHLERFPGRAEAGAAASRQRFHVLTTCTPDEALRLLSPGASAFVCAAALALRDGGQLVQEVRRRRPDLAIVTFLPGAGVSVPASDVSTLEATADRVVDSPAGSDVAAAIEAAIEIRRLAVLVARSEAELSEARERLARLSGSVGPALGGLRPPSTREAVVPFHLAARAYLLSAAELYSTDPRGLAERLGISYFAMRRLLKRYDVPIPGRLRRNHGNSGPKR